MSYFIHINMETKSKNRIPYYILIIFPDSIDHTKGQATQLPSFSANSYIVYIPHN